MACGSLILDQKPSRTVATISPMMRVVVDSTPDLQKDLNLDDAYDELFYTAIMPRILHPTRSK